MPTIMIRGAKTQYDKGVTYETIAKDFQSKYKNRIALVYFNGKMRELHRKVSGDGVLSFITTGDSSGHKAYSRTAPDTQRNIIFSTLCRRPYRSGCTFYR